MASQPDHAPPDSGFEVARRGYDQGQVDAHLRRLDAEIQILAADREAALDQSAQLASELDDSRARAERLRFQVRSLVSPPQSVQGMSERMRSMLRLAEDEASEMLNRANAEAEQQLREAEARAAQLVADAQAEADAIRRAAQVEAERSRDEYARARAEFEVEITAARNQLATDQTAGREQLTAERAHAEQQRVSAWAESESRRKLVEEDFTLAMNRRRSDALTGLTAEKLALEREMADLRSSSTAEAVAHLEQARAAAQRELADAAASAHAITIEAHRRAQELVRLRNRVVDQLNGARAQLSESLDALQPLPEELAATLRTDAPDSAPATPVDASAAGQPDTHDAQSAPASAEPERAAPAAGPPESPVSTEAEPLQPATVEAATVTIPTAPQPAPAPAAAARAATLPTGQPRPTSRDAARRPRPQRVPAGRPPATRD